MFRPHRLSVAVYSIAYTAANFGIAGTAQHFYPESCIEMVCDAQECLFDKQNDFCSLKRVPGMLVSGSTNTFLATTPAPMDVTFAPYV